MQCPKCNSAQIVKYGRTHYGKQRFRCQDCKRQFVEAPSRQPINQATRELIEKLLKERLALAARSRVTGVSERWLQMYVNQKYYALPQEVTVTPKKSVS
jgi:transposase-like protein